MKRILQISFLFFAVPLFASGCARLFGWEFHAPGILSESFERKIEPIHERIALYLPARTLTYISKDRGGRFADPQTFYVGEALGPMMLEGMQQAFDEFIYLEIEPDREILERYMIPYAVVVRIKQFKNHVDLKGQAVDLITESTLYDQNMNKLVQFDSRGRSDAKKVFRKKGGPEVNLNAAIEQDVLSIVQYLQDWMRNRKA